MSRIIVALYFLAVWLIVFGPWLYFAFFILKEW